MSDIDAVQAYRTALRSTYASRDGDECGRTYNLVDEDAADAAIAELQDKLDRAQEYARIEVKRKGEAVERECAAIERAEKAEAALAKCEQQKRGLASAAKAGTVAGNRVIELEAEVEALTRARDYLLHLSDEREAEVEKLKHCPYCDALIEQCPICGETIARYDADRGEA